MKRCTYCNYMERDGANFCSNCGNSSFEEQRDRYWTENESDEEEVFREARKRREKKMYSMLGVLGLIFLLLILFTAVKITLDAKKSGPKADIPTGHAVYYTVSDREQNISE